MLLSPQALLLKVFYGIFSSQLNVFHTCEEQKGEEEKLLGRRLLIEPSVVAQTSFLSTSPINLGLDKWPATSQSGSVRRLDTGDTMNTFHVKNPLALSKGLKEPSRIREMKMTPFYPRK